MNLELLEKKEAPLLSRTEAIFSASIDQQTPSRANARTAVAKNLGVAEELVVIRHIKAQYGKRNAKVTAHIYKSVDAAKRIEGKPVVRKHYPEEKKAAEKEAKAEAPKTE